jgi:hypothetical protein
MPKSILLELGVSNIFVEPVPKMPTAPSPQHVTYPSTNIKHTELCEHTIFEGILLENVIDVVGGLKNKMPGPYNPFPSCPCSPFPQHLTPLLLRMIHVKDNPHATSMACNCCELSTSTCVGDEV